MGAKAARKDTTRGMLSLEGRQLGNYDIIRRIRSGGMGAVYEGRQRTAFGRRVAIKVILGDYAEEREMRRRFAREARTIARLHHPHILPLIEFGDEQGLLYLVMPFIEGGTLNGYLRRHLPDLHEVAAIFLQLLDAVEYAHEEGLVHRDIKASNVLLEPRRSGPPYAYLADFGLVRTIQQAELDRTHAGEPIPLDQVPGTPHYMAPEQTWGVVTPATDIYALGVLLYQMLTGELPYDDPDDVEVIKMHLHAPVPNPCTADASIPIELGAVVARALAKRAEQRFPDVTAFRVALRAAVDGPAAHLEDDFFNVEAAEEFEVYELPPHAPLPPRNPLPAPSPLPPLQDLRPRQQRPSQSLRPASPVQPLPPFSPLPPLRQARPSQQLQQRQPEQPVRRALRPSQQLRQGSPAPIEFRDNDAPATLRQPRTTDEYGEPPEQRRSYTTEENPRDQTFIPRRSSRSLGNSADTLPTAQHQARTTEDYAEALPGRELRARTTEDHAEAPAAVTPPQHDVSEPLASHLHIAIETEQADLTARNVQAASATHRRIRWGRRSHLTTDQTDLDTLDAHAHAHPTINLAELDTPDVPPAPIIRRRSTAQLPSQRDSIQSAGSGRRRGKRSRIMLLTMVISPVLLILLLLVPRALGLNILSAGFPLLGAPSVATINLSVQTRRISDTFLFTASPETTQPDLATRVLPDRSISATVSGSRSVATTGTHSIPGTQASGTLFFSNSAPVLVNVASGTTFTAHNGAQIRLVQALVIPASAGSTNGIASAPGVAVKAGQSGNLAPNTLQTPCCLDAMVTVSNPAAFSGGSDARLAHRVAQGDLDAVRAALVPGLQQQIAQRIDAQLASGEARTGTPIYTIGVTSDHPVGTEATQINVNVSISGSDLVYNTRTVGNLGRQLLSNEAAQSLGTGYRLRNGLSIAPPRLQQQGSAGQLYLSVTASGLWAYDVTAVSEQEWRQAIKGASITLAQNYLSTRPGIRSAHVALPFGTDHLPVDERQIVFVVG